MRFKVCKKCPNSISCCSGRFAEICLLPEEKKFLVKKYGIKTKKKWGIDYYDNNQCQNPKTHKCRLGSDKPFDCKVYPYAFALKKEYYQPLCHGQEYVEILKDKDCPLENILSIKKLLALSQQIIPKNEKWFRKYRKLLMDDSFSGKFNGILIMKYYYDSRT